MEKDNFTGKNEGVPGPAPFREPLSTPDFAPEKADKLGLLKSNPDVVVRRGVSIRQWRTERIKLYQKAKDLFEELRDVYGVPTPNIQLFIGAHDKFKNEPIIYTAVDRIHGKNLWKLLRYGKIKENSEVIGALEDLYVNLLNYVEVKREKSEDFLSDIKNDQFVYGYRKKGESNHIYWVDLDPDYIRQGKRNCLVVFGQIISAILEAEELLGYKLNRVRVKLEAFLKTSSAEYRKEYLKEEALYPISQPLL